jgi:hypothetical protein
LCFSTPLIYEVLWNAQKNCGLKKNISTKTQPKPTHRATHKAKTQIVENFLKRHKKTAHLSGFLEYWEDGKDLSWMLHGKDCYNGFVLGILMCAKTLHLHYKYILHFLSY